jgi:hypothetical protein
MEMADMLRGARNLLQNDLAGATCPTLPWARSDMAVGYFEYYEGQNNDLGPFSVPAAGVPSTLLGDYDDVLMLRPEVETKVRRPQWRTDRRRFSRTLQRRLV